MEKAKHNLENKQKKEKNRDHAQELLEEMIRDGNTHYAETTCDVDRIRGEEERKQEEKESKA